MKSNSVKDRIRAYEEYDRKAKEDGQSNLRKYHSMVSLASPSNSLKKLTTIRGHAGYEEFRRCNREARLYKPFENQSQSQASLQNIAFLSSGSDQSLSWMTSDKRLNNTDVQNQNKKDMFKNTHITSTEHSTQELEDKVPTDATEYSPQAEIDHSKSDYPHGPWKDLIQSRHPTLDNMSSKTAKSAHVRKRLSKSMVNISTLYNVPEDDEALPIKAIVHGKGMSKRMTKSEIHINATANYEVDKRICVNVNRMKGGQMIIEGQRVSDSIGDLSSISAQSYQYIERKNIIESTSETLEAYRQDDNKCNNGLDHLVLERFRNAKRILDATGLLIMKCAEKDGSSDLGKCLLLEYKDTTQCIVGNISEYTSCITGAQGPYCFMVDDAFGATQFDGQQVDNWLINIDRHSAKRTSGSLKLIFVLKNKNVPHCQKFLERYVKSVIDLSEKNNQLRNDEKQYLLKRCIHRKNSQWKKPHIVLSKQTVECIGKNAVSSGFFGMVELFLSKKANTDQGQSFFDKPSDTFYRHICGLRESNDESQKIMYLALAALCLFNGSISTDDITVLSGPLCHDLTHVKRNANSSVNLMNCSRGIKRGNQNAYRPPIKIESYNCLVDVASNMNLKSNIGTHINNGLKHLLGTCVQKTGNNYTFTNQSIETAISLSIGQNFPNVIIKNAKKYFFQEYVGTDMSFEILEKRYIRIDLSNTEICMIAFERLRHALRKCDCQFFVSHPLMRDARFLNIVSRNWDPFYERLVSFFNKRKTFLNTIVSTQDIRTGQNSLILALEYPFFEHSSSSNCNSLGDWVLKHQNWEDIRKENRELCFMVEQRIMVHCCLNKLEDVYMSLVETVSIDEIARCCLDGAIRSGSLNIVEDVLTVSKLSTEDYALALEVAASCYAADIKPQRLDILLELGKYSDKKLLLASIGKSGNYKMLIVAITVFDIDINELITKDGSLIFLLTLYNHWRLFKVAIGDFSANPNFVFKGYMCVHLAAKYNRLRILQILFEKNANVIHERDALGRTPLHLASMRGHTRCVLFLLKNSAAIDATDTYGRTALHKSAGLTKTEVTHLLIANGADINIKEKHSLTAIDIAKSHRNDKHVRKMLGEQRFKNEPYQFNREDTAELFK